MPRRVLVQRGEDSFDLVETPAESEHALQEIMKSHPQLLPADDLGLDGDLLVVGRETTLASGAIDLLCLARSGDLVLVEFKTGPQNPDFRHALAQAIDYGSDLWRLSVDDFDRGVVQRYLNSNHCDPAYRDATDLAEAIKRTGWNLADDELQSLLDRLERVLQTGDFVYVVVAQRFTEAMTRTLDYLNTTMAVGRFYLAEVVRLKGEDLIAHAAQIVAAPAPKRASNASRRTDSGGLLTDEIADPAFRDLILDILSAARSLGLKVDVGSRGGSIRLQTPDRQEPLSVAWVFRDGSQWNGARHLTLGVDPGSLEQTPSVRAAVDAYVATVKAIPGGTQVNSALDAHILTPEVAPRAREAILAAFEDLVASTSAGENA